MKISLKMFGDLRQYLPAGSQFNRCELEMADGATPQQVLGRLTLPDTKTYMLMVNGELVQQGDYETAVLKAGDEVVLFPPIKGG